MAQTNGQQPPKRRRKKNKAASRAMIAAAAIVIALAVGFTALASYVSGLTGIYPGVHMEGLDLGGMSPMEAAEALTAAGITQDGNVTLTVQLPLDNQLVIDVQEAGAISDAQAAAQTAYAYGRSGGFFGNMFTWLRCVIFGVQLSPEGESTQLDEAYIREQIRAVAMEVDSQLMGSDMEIGEDSIRLIKGGSAILVDQDALYALVSEALLAGDFRELTYEPEITRDEGIDLQSLYDTVHCEAQDAYYDKEKGIVAEVTGKDFDLAEAQRLWDEAAPGDEVIIPLTIKEPEVTAAYLEEHLFADELGQRSTGLGGSSAARVNNISLACQAIDGYVLLPGEEFSYNDVVGERTTEKGYQGAGAYLNGQVVTEVGGGICQVSSTLYCAALLANLQITDRTCHYFGVDYLPAGLDATVSWGGPEFKFVNNREFPIKISAQVNNSDWNVSVSIWGTDVDGSYVKLTTTTWAMEGGYGATSYRWVYDKDDNLISKTEEATSRYHYHTEEEEESPSPSPGEEVTPTPSEEVTPTPGTEVTPTPGTEVTPTPGTEVTPTPGTETTPGPGTEVTPAPGTETTPSPGTETTPTPGSETVAVPGTEVTPAA